MCSTDERILIGVSGGKDSLALWDILNRLGYQTTGLYIDLGIGAYSERSHKYALDFANGAGLELKVISLREDSGFDISIGAERSRRPACSVCGISKRHWFNAAAAGDRFDAIATGHNLDDESATLLGNLLHWQSEYVARQDAVLAETDGGFVRKIKPLIRLGEKETAAYCFLLGIEYIVEECPMATGNTGLTYKAALDLLEDASPGTRQMFLGGFLAEGKKHFTAAAERVDLVDCGECGEPTPAPQLPSQLPTAICAYCKLRARASGPAHGGR